MNTETATSVSATHPAVIEMQANTVFHQSTARRTIFIQSIQFETVFLKCTVQLSKLDWNHTDKDLQLVVKESLSTTTRTRINITAAHAPSESPKQQHRGRTQPAYVSTFLSKARCTCLNVTVCRLMHLRYNAVQYSSYTQIACRLSLYVSCTKCTRFAYKCCCFILRIKEPHLTQALQAPNRWMKVTGREPWMRVVRQIDLWWICIMLHVIISNYRV